MTRRLIVNGDDLGRNESLTHGVATAYERGILTSTSIVAGSSHFDLAVALAREHPDLAFGVHLVIDEYPPVSSPADIPSLVDGQGEFLPRSVTLRKILLGQARRHEIRHEWGAQIRKVVDAGIEPTHLDGHGHCHASPTLARTVVELAMEFGIAAVRLPAEPLFYRGGPGQFSLRRYAEKAFLFGACLASRSRWRGRLRHPDTFWGFMDGGRLSPAVLDGIARSLKPGLAELMTHPALDNDDPPYGLDYDWRGDLDTLLAYSKGEFEQRFGIDLVSWRDAWSSP